MKQTEIPIRDKVIYLIGFDRLVEMESKKQCREIEVEEYISYGDLEVGGQTDKMEETLWGLNEDDLQVLVGLIRYGSDVLLYGKEINERLPGGAEKWGKERCVARIMELSGGRLGDYLQIAIGIDRDIIIHARTVKSLYGAPWVVSSEL